MMTIRIRTEEDKCIEFTHVSLIILLSY